MVPSVLDSASRIHFPASPGQNGNDTPGLSAEERFKKVKKKFAIGAGVAGAGGTVALALGALIKGSQFPALFLRKVGGVFSLLSTISYPVAEIGNEFKNYFLARSHNHTNGNSASNGNGNKNDIINFDEWMKVDYRLTSHGLFFYIFGRFLDPENWTKSVFHMAIAPLNVLYTAFTGYTWAFGNTQALIANGFRKAEQIKAKKAEDKGDKSLEEYHRLQASDFDKIVKSAERMLTVGSTANPAMPCLIHAADGLDFISKFFRGESSVGEFFQRPILGISKLASIFVALPEAYAKGVDAFMRVFVTEREHLKPVLPESFYKGMELLGKKIEKEISKDPNEKSLLRDIKNSGEMLFHTASPFAMGILFSEMLGRKHKSEEAQAKGGSAAFIDKWLGRYAKSITTIYTGFYIFFSRLPQGIFQSIYFGRKLIGKYIKKEGDDKTLTALKTLREKIYNNPVIAGVSALARKCIKFCVPNFYDENIENEYGNPKYQDVLAKYSLDQAKEKHKILFKLTELFSVNSTDTRNKKLNEIFQNGIFAKTAELYNHKLNLEEVIQGALNNDKAALEKVTQLLIEECLNYSKIECAQGKYLLNDTELGEIEKSVRNKINFIATPSEQRPFNKLAPLFPGALWLTKMFLNSLDIQSFIPTWHHDKPNKLEQYQGAEINHAFNKEYQVVKAENAEEARELLASLAA